VKRNLLFVLIFFFAAALMFAAGTSEADQMASGSQSGSSTEVEIPNRGTFVEATSNSVETLDPQFMLSTATMELSYNVYDSLLDHPDGDMSKFIPSIASEVPSADNGLIDISADGSTYITFPIRKGIKFHNGDILTPEDVEYTFKRSIVVGAQTSSLSMLTPNLIGENSFSDLIDSVGFDAAWEVPENLVVVKGDGVVFKLPKPFVPFLGIMADGGNGSAILSKSWSIEQGAWPGTKATAQDYLNITMEEDPLFDIMMGSGPFKFVSWEPSKRIVLEAFADYWQGAPEIQKVIRTIVPDTQTALLMLKNGDVDFTTLSVSDLGQVEGAPGITVLKNLPSTWLMKINFIMDIDDGSSYIGDGTLSEEGIPNDFFSDIDVRKAFEYSFDWDVFIDDVFLGAAQKPYGPVLVGFPTANPDNPQYYFDAQKAEEYFRKAWGGELWETGFTMTAVYSSGSTHRQRALEIIKMNVENLNPKFHIELASLPWAGYVGAIKESQLPLTLFGILPDVFDPYYPLFEHMHSAGGYAEWGGYIELAEAEFDPLIDELGTNYDPVRREELSRELQKLDYEYALSIFHFQAVEHVAMQDYVQGYTAGAFPGNLDFYPITKEYK
jgi:peptide/nickel transport system substrate-binding protein